MVSSQNLSAVRRHGRVAAFDLLTDANPLYLETIDGRGAGHSLQRGEQSSATGSQLVEAAQAAAQPVQALVHTLQRRPVADHTGLSSARGTHCVALLQS